MNDIRAVLGRRGVWGPIASIPAAELRPYVARAAALGYGSLWVGEGAARDPFALLAAVSEASGELALGTSIVNIFGRDAMASRMGAMTVHELSGGRFVLGLGVSHEHLVQKLRGHLYEKPLTHMREYLEAYGSLPYRGPAMRGPDGEVDEPPVMIAALRPRMLELAATATDGTLPFLVSAARLAWMRDVLDGAVPAGRGRPVLATTVAVIVGADEEKARAIARAWIVPYCRAPNYQASFAEQGYEAEDWEPPYSDRLIDDMVAWGDVATVRDRLAQLDAAGADHVAIIPLGGDGSASSLGTLEALAPLPPS
ncbi:MAG: LLM class flavin-dependent oxidoreductase [Chloroflexota bacterium]